MKKFIAVFIFTFTLHFVFGQSITISEASRAMQNGTYNSFLFELPDVGKKEAEEVWKKFMKDFKAKSKYDRKSKLWVSENAQMPRLSEKPVNVYARILEDSNPKKRTSVIVWFNSRGGYVNSTSDKPAGNYAKDILTEYGMTTSKYYADMVVDTEEKSLSKLEDELKKLRKDNSDYYKAIEKAKETIAKMEKDIEINEQDQKNKEVEIKNQKKVLDGAKTNAKKFN